MILYNKFIARHGALSAGGGKLSEAQLNLAVDLLKNLYVTAAETGDPHGTVAFLIKKGLAEESLNQEFKDKKFKETRISEGASRLMAQAREQMIEATITEVIASHQGMLVALYYRRGPGLAAFVLEHNLQGPAPGAESAQQENSIPGDSGFNH